MLDEITRDVIDRIKAAKMKEASKATTNSEPPPKFRLPRVT